MDANPRTNAADVFIAGKTTEQVVRAIDDGTAPEGTLRALRERFDRKQVRREARAAAA